MGHHALLVLVEGPAQAIEASALVRRIAASHDGPSRLPEPVDVVTAARSVLIDGLPDPRSVAAWRDLLHATHLDGSDLPGIDADAHEVVIAMSYDGPDLDLVADAWSCSREEVIARHQAADFRVAFCGFAPGFAYCTSQPVLPEVPRRPDPRGRVPAGSVALGAEYCGIYPRDLPGGWQIIGRTDEVIFDADRPQPSLLAPGDRVRFRAAR